MNRRLTSDYCPQTVAILGAARSGIAAAQFFVARGVAVFVSDICDRSKLDGILAANNLVSIGSEAGGHTDRVLDAEVIIVSPGVARDIPILQKARQKGIAIWSELELSYRFSKAQFLAVTGSSGKSTTISLLGAICSAAGRESIVAGNIGIPLISVTPGLSKDAIVAAEVSSFQLEYIDQFCPRGAAILNLQKNHLDRYGSEDEYYDAKKAIVTNMTMADTLVLNANDGRLFAWAALVKTKVRVVYFGADVADSDCVYCNHGVLYSRTGSIVTTIGTVDRMKLRGQHNYDNASAAIALALSAGISIEACRTGIEQFAGLPHRLEFVAEKGGVRYYNDSKATTAESMLCAITAFGRTVHLIAGGRDKGCDFTLLSDAIKANVKKIYLIGEAADRMERLWAQLAPICRCATLDSAVSKASIAAVAGDAVVLSPGCSSFDMFKNYEDRGEAFRKTVNSLAVTSGVPVV